MASGAWKQTAYPDGYLALWEKYSPGVKPPVPYWHPSGLTALVGRESWADEEQRWHISLRYGDPGTNGRIPSWDELVMAAHELRPGVVFVVGIPPRSWWMNIHPHVLHLMETRDAPLIEQFRVNAAGQVPS